MQFRKSIVLIVFILCTSVINHVVQAQPSSEAVRVRLEKAIFPTYEMGEDETAPMFRGYRFPGDRVYRKTRSIYPYTVQEDFSQNKIDIEYDVLILENEYIRVDIMPQLRGRLQGAIDKRNDWDFIYYNHVIKPADIAIRKAWISGGLEWTHPGGHGYSQFNKISYKIIEEPDGAKTVLVGEIEPVRMLKWETAITLRPGRLYVETTGRFFSIKPFPIPFASSLNGAMHATEKMEAIYPEGTYITGHGKKNLVKWPVFYGQDWSVYGNVKRILSIFAEQCPANFYGCYSHEKDIEAGTLVVCDRRTAPGKKYFTWGSQPKGRRWDTILSDEDGPYIELQVGAFWDNLGYGNAWLDPLEVKEYTVYWIPVKDIGGFVQANKDLCVNLKQINSNDLKISVQATREIKGANVILQQNGADILRETIDLTPAIPYVKTLKNINRDNILFDVISVEGVNLISYNSYTPEAEAPKLPKKDKQIADMTMDELYSKAKSFYQDYFSDQSEKYFLEMLHRDPNESRANNALGIMKFARGQLEQAEAFFQKANQNAPLINGYESSLFLGMIEMDRGNYDKARELLFTSSRIAQFKIQSLYELAKLEFLAGDSKQALAYLDEAVQSGGTHPNLWNLMAIIQRKAGCKEAAKTSIQQALNRDALDFIAIAENWFVHSGSTRENAKSNLRKIFDRRSDTFVGSQLFIETALTYMQLKLWDDAVSILNLDIDYYAEREPVYPMLEYYAGYCYEKSGDKKKAKALYKSASKKAAEYIFPYRPYSIRVLQAALSANPKDANGWMYLGNLYTYLRRYEEGKVSWEKALAYNSKNAMIYRNLANAIWHLNQDTSGTIQFLKKAIQLQPDHLRLYQELDMVYHALGMTAERIALFENNLEIVSKNNDLALRWHDLLLRLKRYEEALDILENNWFYAREAKMSVHTRHAECQYGIGQELLQAGEPAEALAAFKKAEVYPDNFSEGRPDNPILSKHNYLIGLAHEAAGKLDLSKKYWQAVVESRVREGTDSEYYKGLALMKLEKKNEAVTIFKKLLRAREENVPVKTTTEKTAIDYYLISKVYAQLGRNDIAVQYLKKAITLDADVKLSTRIEATIIISVDI